MNGIRTSMIATFSFFIESIYNCYLYCFMGAIIHQPLSHNGFHPQISLSLRLLVLCHVLPDLFVVYYCLLIFLKNTFLSLVPLTNATPAFLRFDFFFKIMRTPWKKQKNTKINCLVGMDSGSGFVTCVEYRK